MTILEAFDQHGDESDDEYLERLQATIASGQLLSLKLAKYINTAIHATQKRLRKQRERESGVRCSTLLDVKRGFAQLPAKDRREFMEWVTRGMPRLEPKK